MLFELETDKKITLRGDGRRRRGVITLGVEAGAEVKIGQVVATIGDRRGRRSPVAERPPRRRRRARSRLRPRTCPSRRPPSRRPPAAPSPAVRRIASETGVNPAEVPGTGKAGRVTKGDMLSASEKPAAAATPQVPSAAPAPQSGERQTRRKLTPLRLRIAVSALSPRSIPLRS